MSTNPLHLEPIDKIVDRHVNGKVSISETVSSCTDRIAQVNKKYNAVVWSDPAFIQSEIARAQTQLADDTKKYPLLGVPLLVKEIDSNITGVPNSWGNMRLKEMSYCDTFTSTSVTLLHNAGAIIVGKTNNPELALTVTTYGKAHGPCNNPLDITRNAGGSSGGSAAAIASGMVSVAGGSDGGGSIRIPAAACGVYGFKPSRDLISLGPIHKEFWAGLVCKGLVASNMGDLVRVLDVLAEKPDAFTHNIHSKPKNLRIGIRTVGFGSIYPMDSSVMTATEKVAEFLESQGHRVETSHPRSYDNTSFLTSFLDIISYNTFLDINFLTRITNNTLDIETCDPVTQYFHSEGTKMKESDYIRAQEAIDPFTHAHDEWFDDFDILITPTSGKVAPLHGAVEQDPEIGPLIYGGLCMPSNVAGTPALSVPVISQDTSGLPAGVQIIGARGQDDLVLRLGNFLENHYPDIFVTPSEYITS